MRFYNFLKRKPIKQSKKHKGQDNPDTGRWKPTIPPVGMGARPEYEKHKLNQKRGSMY